MGMHTGQRPWELAWGRTDRNDKIRRKEPTKGKTEKTVTVKQGDLTQTLELSGHLQAEENLTLRFQTSGLLTWVAVKEGDWVRRGQALATLDRRALEKTLKKELNDYSKERADFEQDQDDHKLVREGLVIDYEIRRILDKAQWDLENSVIDVELADLSHRLAVLSSPIAGIVTKVVFHHPQSYIYRLLDYLYGCIIPQCCYW